MHHAPLDYDTSEPDRERSCLCCMIVSLCISIPLWLLVCWLFAQVFFWATEANAHDATPTAAQPTGWAYPGNCCSGIDCRQVPASAIIEGPNGYTIKATGEVIPMTDPKVKMSPDGEFHWCSQQGRDDGKTICLFTPGRGS